MSPQELRALAWLGIGLVVWSLGCGGRSTVPGDGPVDAGGDADADVEPEPVRTWVWDIWSTMAPRQYAAAVAAAEEGGVYIAGYHDATPGGWVARYDSDGRPRWELRLSGWIGGAAAHPDGGVVVVGHGSLERPAGAESETTVLCVGGGG